MSDSTDTFNLGDLRRGDSFDYMNGTKTVSGVVGEVCSHDNDTVHVVHDVTGCPVCSIRSGSTKIPCGNAILIPTGERTLVKLTAARATL